MALDLGSILAGTSIVVNLKKVKTIVEEGQNDSAVIIVDEIHTLVGALLQKGP
jgi:ATP-dependent Clp protease ATP-binding subunit ClpA